MMTLQRREFITLLGGAAPWPLAARAQQQGDRVRRIGVLLPLDENDPVFKPVFSAFTQSLAELGWADGRNARMDLRWAGPDINRMRASAKELVSLQPDIIVTIGSTAATVALQAQTRTIPIVFTNVADPVASGLVARLDRPSESRFTDRLAPGLDCFQSAQVEPFPIGDDVQSRRPSATVVTEIFPETALESALVVFERQIEHITMQRTVVCCQRRHTRCDRGSDLQEQPGFSELGPRCQERYAFREDTGNHIL